MKTAWEVDAKTGCWMWTLYVDPYGYGRDNTSRVYAHRWSYEQHVGPIPEGMVIDHLCHNQDLSCDGGDGCPHRRCINPAHLGVVTPSQNSRSGRGFASERAAQTHCKHGHEFTPTNTYRRSNGTRNCRICKSEAMRRYYERRASK